MLQMPRFATLVFALLLGCGDDASSSMDGGMNAGGSSGIGGSGGSGGSGSGGDGAAGRPPDAMAGRGGTGGGAAGSDAAGDGGRDAGGDGGSDAGVDHGEAAEVLSELSEGLTAPTMDCRTAEGFIVGCVSASGTYNDTPFDFSCVDDGGLVYVSNDGGGVQCRGEVSGDPFHVNLNLGPAQPRAPGAFAVASANADTWLSFQHFARELQSHRNGVYELEGTYDRRLAVVGSAELDANEKLIMEGEFAASYTPASTCTPDASDFGCDTLKVRGNFAAFPIVP
jgi:hypothetical protein